LDFDKPDNYNLDSEQIDLVQYIDCCMPFVGVDSKIDLWEREQQQKMYFGQNETDVNPNIQQHQPEQSQPSLTQTSEKTTTSNVPKQSKIVFSSIDPPTSTEQPKQAQTEGQKGSGSGEEEKPKPAASTGTICKLCKRKFKDLEALTAHEDFSNLHRENLERLQATEK